MEANKAEFQDINIPGDNDQNKDSRKAKFQRKLERFEDVYNTVNKVHKLGFRAFVLVFIILIEIALFVTVFCNYDMNGAEATAIIIVAVLPILVMRAFDITALNLTKEGFASTMAQNSNEIPFKISEIPSNNSVKAKSDKFIQIEYEGKLYKLAIVEEINS